jgi:tetratricopeptide (TPR) repeat protein
MPRPTRAWPIRAIELDDSLAEAHASLGYILKNRFEWEAAEKSLRRAIELKPGYAQAHHWYSIYLSQHGRFPEALEESKVAISLDPLAMSTNAQLGAVLLLARRYDEAIEQHERVLLMDPSFASAHQIIGEASAYKGDYVRALTSYEMASKVGALGREDHEQLADRGFALAMSGRRREAEQVAAELLQRYQRNPRGVAANIATIYVAIGETDLAFKWLSEGLVRQDPELGYLKVDPRWDRLRSDPRFAALLARVGFQPD